VSDLGGRHTSTVHDQALGERDRPGTAKNLLCNERKPIEEIARRRGIIVDKVKPQIRIDARFIPGAPFFSIRTLARTFETVFVFAPPLSPNDPVPSWNVN
jgi:hypothetical protein